MPGTKPPAQIKRKRTRKRKRRAAFSSSSSSSSSDSSSSDNEQDNTTAPHPAPKATEPPSPDSESSSSVESSDEETPRRPITVKDQTKESDKIPSQRLAPSPSPPPVDLPSFLPQQGPNSTDQDHQMKEQEMKTKFRQFWMSSVAEGFRDDLEEIRKEPNLGTSRLALLIDSLASGADVFSSSSDSLGINEMEVILG